MGTINRAIKNVSGTKDWVIGASLLAAEINEDLNSIYDEFNGSIDADNLATGCVTAIKIGSSAVETAKINNHAVTTDKIAPNAVTSVEIEDADGTSGQDTTQGEGVKSPHIQDDAVITSKIEDLAVTTAKINLLAVDTEQIADGAVTDDKLAGTLFGADQLDWRRLTAEDYQNSVDPDIEIDLGPEEQIVRIFTPETTDYNELWMVPEITAQMGTGSVSVHAEWQNPTYVFAEPGLNKLYHGRLVLTIEGLEGANTGYVYLSWRLIKR